MIIDDILYVKHSLEKNELVVGNLLGAYFVQVAGLFKNYSHGVSTFWINQFGSDFWVPMEKSSELFKLSFSSLVEIWKIQRTQLPQEVIAEVCPLSFFDL